MLTLPGRRSASRSDGRGEEEITPASDSGPLRRAPWYTHTRWYTRASTGAGLAAALVVGAVVTVSPANGAAGNIATGFVRAVRQLGSTSKNAQAFAGTAAVGALVTTSAGELGQHFCTASVINSPNGDLAITAAHCVTGTSGTIVFVPGYDNGATSPYGIWTVTKVYVDQAWSSSASPDDDVAILRVSQPGSTVPIEDVTGADQLVTGTPAIPELVDVIGYPDSSNQAISCQNWLKEPMTDQLEFDCGGYTDGTSGGPVLKDVDPATGQGTVIGVIGGYEQGGYTPQVSYSAVFGPNVAALYQTAVAGG